MKFIQKYKYDVIFALGILILYLVLRLLYITNLPIFTDEAIYIRWAQIALNDASWRFISLTDGKQPLFVWIAMIIMKFVSDPLLAGRFVSVFAGLVSLFGIWFLTYELFRKRSIAFFSSLIYICYPFAQVYDRMALYDSLAGALTLWSFYFAILLVRHIRLDTGLILGALIGLGVLNKSTNFFSLYLLPFTLLLFDFSKRQLNVRIFKWVLLSLLAAVIAQGMYAILRLSPLFHMVEQKNALFIYPFSEWKNHPFEFFTGDLIGLLKWQVEYLKLPYVMLIIFAFKKKEFIKEKILLFIYFILPLLALALFARILYPRFIYFMSLSLLPLAAYGLYDLISIAVRILQKYIGSSKKHLIYVFMTLIFISYPLYVSITFILDPINSNISHPDNSQYVNHWTAGWGVRESVNYLENISKTRKIFIATEGTFGLMPFAYEIYLVDNPNVTIKGYWPVEHSLPDEVKKSAAKVPTFMAFYQPNNIEPPDPEHLELVLKVKAGKSDYFFRLYKVVGFNK